MPAQPVTVHYDTTVTPSISKTSPTLSGETISINRDDVTGIKLRFNGDKVEGKQPTIQGVALKFGITSTDIWDPEQDSDFLIDYWNGQFTPSNPDPDFPNGVPTGAKTSPSGTQLPASSVAPGFSRYNIQSVKVTWQNSWQGNIAFAFGQKVGASGFRWQRSIVSSDPVIGIGTASVAPVDVVSAANTGAQTISLPPNKLVSVTASVQSAGQQSVTITDPSGKKVYSVSGKSPTGKLKWLKSGTFTSGSDIGEYTVTLTSGAAILQGASSVVWDDNAYLTTYTFATNDGGTGGDADFNDLVVTIQVFRNKG